MRAEPRLPRIVLALLASSLVGSVLVGCTPEANTPPPSTPTASFPSNPFTVMTTDRIDEVDPAGVTDQASTILSGNVYQTLMSADPGQGDTIRDLKPDAAQDCIVDAPKVYVCTLRDDLTFHNGHAVTSTDVKFSIDRAIRLDVEGSSVSLLSSLRRIETPDAKTVRFELSRDDSQFGWALASPAAAIVDHTAYDPDRLQPIDDDLVGSGPFRVDRRTDTELDLVKFDRYIGRTVPRYPYIAVKTVPDSATIEDAIAAKQVDVVWRGLSAAALTRYGQQIDASSAQTTTDGYSRALLPGARVHQLQWNPESRRFTARGLRRAVAAALQEDRTSDSVVPAGVIGHAATFTAGGRAEPKITWSGRINLTLSYDSTMPDGIDLANQVRNRLEAAGGLSVRLVPDDRGTDLQLVDRKAWTSTGIAWLQPYLDHPLKGSAAKVQTLETDYRASTDDAESNRLLAELQQRAATDLTVLPVDQTDEVVFFRSGVTVGETTYGPGWQLGLWGMTRA